MNTLLICKDCRKSSKELKEIKNVLFYNFSQHIPSENTLDEKSEVSANQKIAELLEQTLKACPAEIIPQGYTMGQLEANNKFSKLLFDSARVNKLLQAQCVCSALYTIKRFNQRSNKKVTLNEAYSTHQKFGSLFVNKNICQRSTFLADGRDLYNDFTLDEHGSCTLPYLRAMVSLSYTKANSPRSRVAPLDLDFISGVVFNRSLATKMTSHDHLSRLKNASNKNYIENAKKLLKIFYELRQGVSVFCPATPSADNNLEVSKQNQNADYMSRQILYSYQMEQCFCFDIIESMFVQFKILVQDGLSFDIARDAIFQSLHLPNALSRRYFFETAIYARHHSNNLEGNFISELRNTKKNTVSFIDKENFTSASFPPHYWLEIYKKLMATIAYITCPFLENYFFVNLLDSFNYAHKEIEDALANYIVKTLQNNEILYSTVSGACTKACNENKYEIEIATREDAQIFLEIMNQVFCNYKNRKNEKAFSKFYFSLNDHEVGIELHRAFFNNFLLGNIAKFAKQMDG